MAKDRSVESPAPVAADNPKGKLLEFCARARCAPTFDHLVSGSMHGASVALVVDGEELHSGVHWATERTLAEQRAASALLSQLAALEDEGDAGEWVSEGEAAELRASNPKGRLLEHCVRAAMPAPSFDVRPVVTLDGPGFEATAHLVVGEDEIWGDVRRASTAKAAEQATAASLLARLPGVAAAEPVKVTAIEPVSVLNELRQKNAIRDYAFAVQRIEGPPHAPVFRLAGFSVRADGSGVEVRDVEAASKKEGERRAAVQLLDKLRS